MRNLNSVPSLFSKIRTLTTIRRDATKPLSTLLPKAGNAINHFESTEKQVRCKDCSLLLGSPNRSNLVSSRRWTLIASSLILLAWNWPRWDELLQLFWTEQKPIWLTTSQFLFHKVGCVFPTVSILSRAEFKPKDHREDAPHFISHFSLISIAEKRYISGCFSWISKSLLNGKTSYIIQQPIQIIFLQWNAKVSQAFIRESLESRFLNLNWTDSIDCFF